MIVINIKFYTVVLLGEREGKQNPFVVYCFIIVKVIQKNRVNKLLFLGTKQIIETNKNEKKQITPPSLTPSHFPHPTRNTSALESS